MISLILLYLLRLGFRIGLFVHFSVKNDIFLNSSALYVLTNFIVLIKI